MMCPPEHVLCRRDTRPVAGCEPICVQAPWPQSPTHRTDSLSSGAGPQGRGSEAFSCLQQLPGCCPPAPALCAHALSCQGPCWTAWWFCLSLSCGCPSIFHVAPMSLSCAAPSSPSPSPVPLFSGTLQTLGVWGAGQNHMGGVLGATRWGRGRTVRPGLSWFCSNCSFKAANVARFLEDAVGAARLTMSWAEPTALPDCDRNRTFCFVGSGVGTRSCLLCETPAALPHTPMPPAASRLQPEPLSLSFHQRWAGSLRSRSASGLLAGLASSLCLAPLHSKGALRTAGAPGAIVRRQGAPLPEERPASTA